MQHTNKEHSPHIRSTSMSAGCHFKPDIMEPGVEFVGLIFKRQLSDRIIGAHIDICDIWHDERDPAGYIHINDD